MESATPWKNYGFYIFKSAVLQNSYICFKILDNTLNRRVVNASHTEASLPAHQQHVCLAAFCFGNHGAKHIVCRFRYRTEVGIIQNGLVITFNTQRLRAGMFKYGINFSLYGGFLLQFFPNRGYGRLVGNMNDVHAFDHSCLFLAG